MVFMLSLVLLKEGLAKEFKKGEDMDDHGNLMQGCQSACVGDSRTVKSFLSDSAVACGQSINGLLNDQRRRPRCCSHRALTPALQRPQKLLVS